MSATKTSPVKSLTRLTNSEGLKAKLAERLPISKVAEDVLGLELYPAGSQYKACCPLHDEDTPSCYFNDAKGEGGLFHCFGCKEGGDTIGLLRKARNLGYVEALEQLAETADIDMAEYQRPLTPEELEREQLRQSVEKWMAGLNTPDAGRVSSFALNKFGVVEAKGRGVVNSGMPDYLFKGTIFPYRLPNGLLVGWKARQEKTKKFFAVTKDTPFYQPTLFGIQEAREWVQDGVIYVVEGEYDQLATFEHQPNVVATGGSAFTDDHLKLLLDIKIRRAVFLFDGDEGGKTGATSVAKRYWNHPEIEIWIGDMPEGADPEDLAKLGLNPTKRPRRHALEWLLWQDWQEHKDGGLGGKLGFLEHVRSVYGSKLDVNTESMVATEVGKWLELPEGEAVDLMRVDSSPLQATDSERVLLGACLRNQAYFLQLRKRLGRDDFFMLRHRRLWTLLEQMTAEGLELDHATVQAQVIEQGLGIELTPFVQSADANLGWHEDRVLDLAIRRAAREQTDKFREQITDVGSDAIGLIGDLTNKVAVKALDRRALSQIDTQVDSAMETLHERMRNPDEVHGISLGTQFPTLTTSLQGLQERRLVLLAAASGVGKSTICLQYCAELAVHQSVPTDFISLEMDYTEMLFKLASHLTGIGNSKITGGHLEEDEATRVEHAMARIRKSPLRLYAPDGMTTNEFLLYCRESKLQRRTEVFFLDYAQLIHPEPGSTRIDAYTLYGNFGRDAKQAARAMDVSMFCVAQLNRAAKELERPTKENMGDSYDLVRHADVILIMSDNEDSEMVDLWIDKNRQGASNHLIPIVANLSTATFHEAHGGLKLPEYTVGA